MGNSSGSMLYMVVLLIIIYVVGMGIYQGVKFINVNDGLDEYREKCRKELAELLQILDKLIYVASR